MGPCLLSRHFDVPGSIRSCLTVTHARSFSFRYSQAASACWLLVEGGKAGAIVGGAAILDGHLERLAFFCAPRPDTANVRDVLLAEPDRVRFAGRALPRGPFLRGGGPRP